MSLLILLAIFWKPIYKLSLYGYYTYKKDPEKASLNLNLGKNWFLALLDLVKP